MLEDLQVGMRLEGKEPLQVQHVTTFLEASHYGINYLATLHSHPDMSPTYMRALEPGKHYHPTLTEVDINLTALNFPHRNDYLNSLVGSVLPQTMGIVGPDTSLFWVLHSRSAFRRGAQPPQGGTEFAELYDNLFNEAFYIKSLLTEGVSGAEQIAFQLALAQAAGAAIYHLNNQKSQLNLMFAEGLTPLRTATTELEKLISARRSK
jgi:hypothetical protein